MRDDRDELLPSLKAPEDFLKNFSGFVLTRVSLEKKQDT